MRIALIHSFYRRGQPSGENTIVLLQKTLLEERGHRVRLVARYSDDLAPGRRAQVRTALEVATGHGPDPSQELRDFEPDVIHVHNLFPNFGSDWLGHWAGPVVATVHNFRPLCVNALLFREGEVCTLCPSGHRWAGVRHGCYRDSAVASVPLAWRNRKGAAHDPVMARADRLILLSERARSTFARFDAPMTHATVIPNGVSDPGFQEVDSASGARWVAVGRLSAEKGFLQLLEDWPSGHQLDIIGAGPLGQRLQEAQTPGIRIIGEVAHDEVMSSLQASTAAVFSGVNLEGAYPLTAVEALASGRPLIAREGGAAAAMVDRWGCGWTFGDRPSLAAALAGSAADPEAGRRARAVYDEQFSATAWIDALEGVYRDVSGRG